MLLGMSDSRASLPAPEALENTVSTNKSRKDMRAMVSLVARYRSPTTFDYASEECTDVSVGGMFIKSVAPAPAGTLLKLECDSGPGSAPDAKIRGVARVVWLRREDSDNGPSGMGVKFVKLEPGSRELIAQIIRNLTEAGVHSRTISSLAPEEDAAAALRPAESGAQASGEAEDGALPAPERRSEPADPSVASGRLSTPWSGAPVRAAGASRTDEVPATRSPSTRPPAAPGTRPSSRPGSGSVRPVAPRSASKFGVRGWLILLALVLIGVAIADQRGLGGSEASPSAPEPGEARPADPASPSSPQPELPAVVQAEARGALAEAARAPSEPAPSDPHAAQPRAGEPQPQPTVAQPTAAAQPLPSAADPQPSAAEPGSPEQPPPSAAAVVEGAPRPGAYVIDFVSRPSSTGVTIDGSAQLVTPASFTLDAVPKRIKITARREGYRSSSIWLDLKPDSFELKDEVYRRRVYLTLRPEPAYTPP